MEKSARTAAAGYGRGQAGLSAGHASWTIEVDDQQYKEAGSKKLSHNTWCDAIKSVGFFFIDAMDL